MMFLLEGLPPVSKGNNMYIQKACLLLLYGILIFGTIRARCTASGALHLIYYLSEIDSFGIKKSAVFLTKAFYF